MEILVHALRQGRVKELCRATLHEGVATAFGLAILVDERAMQYNNLIVFEGRLLHGGLPKSARSLTYRDSEDDVTYIASNNRKVIQIPGIWGQVSPQDAMMGEIVMQDDAQMACALAVVHAFIIPKSKEGTTRGIGYRFKSRSLERQYIMFQSFQNEVRFLTCNSWA